MTTKGSQVVISAANFIVGRSKEKMYEQNTGYSETKFPAHGARFCLVATSLQKGAPTLRVAALDSNLLLAFGHMEWVQQHARTVPKQVKHLARTLAAMRVDCPWCLDFGMLESQEMGIHEEKLQALLDYQHSPQLSEQEVLVLRSAEAMSQMPVRVPDDLFAALKAHYSERQLVELTFLIAWEQWVARFNCALGIEADAASGKRSCLVLDAHVSGQQQGSSE